VVGTSLFQIIFVAANVTVLQAATNMTVDIVLALVLIVGAVIGAQIGTSVGARLRGEQLRGLLALMVLAVCARLGYSLVATPTDLYSLGESLGP
ncbi:MAG: sulfite exporter TauE/SafE family protein, partial [Alphaproteobacteria bacterium]|nr:sulfite exporter TauE/SafE family protein [Alphaproteobacteria bacterium]